MTTRYKVCVTYDWTMLRFGPFEVDFATSEVRKSGTRVRIQEQPLRILQALLEQRGEMVSREELRKRLWPSDTHVDFDGSLNAAVGKLRQCLHDSADRPIYIETVARKGYRFIAPVTDSTPIPQSVPPPVTAVLKSSRWLLLAGALTAALLILLMALRMAQRVDPERRVLLLDVDVGNEVSQPAISPDGATLAFIAGNQLTVRRLDNSRIRALAGTVGASSPFFSPDGKWIGYFANHQLRKIAVDGGESVTLCSAPLDRGGTWTEDGQIVAALSQTGELSVVSANGGTPLPFSNFKGESPEMTSHRMPVALPHGKGILFVSGAGVGNGILRVQDLRGGPAKTLINGSSTARYLAASGHVLFSRNGTVFAAPMDLDRLELTGPESPLIEGVLIDHFSGGAFDVSGSATLVYRAKPPLANREVVWLEPSGTGNRVLPRTGAYASPRLSQDGKRLALTSEGEVWIYDFGKESMARLTFGAERRCCPVWSPDGEYLAFASTSALEWTKGNGSGPVERMEGSAGTNSVPFSFSPDGKWLVFHRNESRTGFDIWAAPVDRAGGSMRLGKPQVLVQQAGLQAAPQISPDGRWLAYGSDDETGRVEVYVIPFLPHGPTAGGKWQVSTEGGRGPKWSRDSREIVFRAKDDTLMAAACTVRGNSFQSVKPRLWSTKRLTTGEPFPNFDVAPNGKGIVAVLDSGDTKPDETHLRVLLNADVELRRQLSNFRNPK